MDLIVFRYNSRCLTAVALVSGTDKSDSCAALLLLLP